MSVRASVRLCRPGASDKCAPRTLQRTNSARPGLHQQATFGRRRRQRSWPRNSFDSELRCDTCNWRQYRFPAASSLARFFYCRKRALEAICMRAAEAGPVCGATVNAVGQGGGLETVFFFTISSCSAGFLSLLSLCSPRTSCMPVPVRMHFQRNFKANTLRRASEQVSEREMLNASNESGRCLQTK